MDIPDDACNIKSFAEIKHEDVPTTEYIRLAMATSHFHRGNIYLFYKYITIIPRKRIRSFREANFKIGIT